MAKLTNLQMGVLAERATDILEKEMMIKNKELLQSDKYKNFEIEYSDENTELFASYKLEIDKIDETIKLLADKKYAILDLSQELGRKLNLGIASWERCPKSLFDKYMKIKKNEIFPNVEFNRAVVFKKLQADILLGEVGSPNEIISVVVDKFRNDLD